MPGCQADCPNAVSSETNYRDWRTPPPSNGHASSTLGRSNATSCWKSTNRHFDIMVLATFSRARPYSSATRKRGKMRCTPSLARFEVVLCCQRIRSLKPEAQAKEGVTIRYVPSLARQASIVFSRSRARYGTIREAVFSPFAQATITVARGTERNGRHDEMASNR